MRHALRHPIQFRRDHRFTAAHVFDFLDGELPPASARRVEEHASRCPMCRDIIASMRRTMTALRGIGVAATAEPRAGNEDSPITAAVLRALRERQDPPGS